MVSGTTRMLQEGRFPGQTAEAFLISIAHVPLLSIDSIVRLSQTINPHLEVIAHRTDLALSAHRKCRTS